MRSTGITSSWGGFDFAAGQYYPSFHRRELAAAASTFGASDFGDPNYFAENRYSFRPVFVDKIDNGSSAPGADGLADPGTYPTASMNFPGVQPYDHDGNALTPMIIDYNRPLVVDNTGDGNNDSIWMDIGAPVQSVESGALVKPMVAIHIQDMDHRLNLNAHGSEAQARTDKGMVRRALLGTTGIQADMGMGYGTADISFESLLGVEYTRLFNGYRDQLGDLDPATYIDYEGRYGVNNVPGNTGRDAESRVRLVGYPEPGFNTTSNIVGGLFTSQPVDLHGRFAYGFLEERDPVYGVPVGQPMSDMMSSTRGSSDIIDSPYEFNMLQSSATYYDQPFTAAELARVFFTDDDQLPNRLYELLDFTGAGGTNARDFARQMFTTHSFEVPRVPLVTGVLGGSYVSQTLTERMFDAMVTNSTRFPNAYGTLTEQEARLVLQQLLAPEVLRGLPMNLNRMFGDGLDNDGDLVFDEHWPSTNSDENEALVENVQNVAGAAVAMDPDNDGLTRNTTPVDNNEHLSRQIFARQLFVLTWLVSGSYNMGTMSLDPPDMTGDGAQDGEDIDALAQWCVNVVDFRDADSIMTPFEFDRNPFNGWGCDGDITTTNDTNLDGSPMGADRGYVWGAERPELLISEATATHNAASEDLSADGGTNGSGDNHSDFDSEMVPVASFFLELMNPNGSTVSPGQRFHSELDPTAVDAGNTPFGVDLTGNATYDPSDPNNINLSTPIWRAVVTEGRHDSPTAASARRIYMRQPGPSVEPTGVAGKYYYPNQDIVDATSVLPPQQYAVIGSAGVHYTQGGEEIYRTSFGRRTDATVDHVGLHAGTDLLMDQTRSIKLIPGVGVRTLDGSGDPLVRGNRTCVAIPIDKYSDSGTVLNDDLSLGISDPDGGYVNALSGTFPGLTASPFMPGGGAVQDGDGLIFNQILPQPADILTAHDPRLLVEGNLGAYRYVQLQRLANPQVAYDAVENPYITVDIQPVDLTVFNGHTATNDPSLANGNVDFNSFERGATEPTTGSAVNRRLLWPQDPVRTQPTSDVANLAGADNHHFSFEFQESLGEMNAVYRDAAFTQVAYPAMTWANRPFISGHELTLVPKGSGARRSNGYQQANEMLASFQLPNVTAMPSHLLDFRDDTNGLYRLLEYVEVPTRFVGNDLYFNPAQFMEDRLGFTSTGLPVPNETTGYETRMLYNPPYNSVPRYRTPGKINLNTILDERIWNAVMDEYATAGTAPISYANLNVSRRGAPAGTPTFSEFVNPFRAVGMGAFVPPGTTPQTDSEPTMLRERTATAKLFDRVSRASYADTRRSAVFRDMPMTKLRNIATTRSSVFAIWITIGYFEVNSVDVDGDGDIELGEKTLLGREYIDPDTNDTIRARAFYMYDRSIPVAFEPGNNHNIERGILVQTILESGN